MTITGKLGAGGNERATLAVPVPGQPNGQGGLLPHRPAEETQPPFVTDLKRPDKVRFELEFNKETAIQVFDGGRAGSSGRTSIARKLSRFLRKK
jgi:hypothetical protein